MNNFQPSENHFFNQLAIPVWELPCFHKASLQHPGPPGHTLMAHCKHQLHKDFDCSGKM